MRNSSILMLGLGLLAMLLAACTTVPTAESTAAQSAPEAEPTIASTAEPPPYREPASPITAENANRLQYLGRLDTPNSLKSSIFSHSFSPDSTRLAALDNDLLMAWDLTDGRLIFSTDRAGAVRVFYSPDKTEIYTVNNNGDIFIYGENGTLQNTLEGSVGFTGAYAYMADQGLLALANESGTIKVWDLAERASLATFNATDAPLAALAISDDTQLLAAAGLNGHLVVWDWQEREQIADFDHEGNTINSVIFAGDSDRVATATASYIAVWSLEAESLDYALQLEEAGASGIFTYTPDGKLLITAGRNAPLNIWDAANNTMIGQLADVSGNRMTAAFSPDSSLMVTAVLDQQINLWNLADTDGETIQGAPLNIGTTRITDVAWTDDGFIMAFFGTDGTIYLWGIAE